MYYVYKITCNKSDKAYIGSTNNVEKRFKRHEQALKNGTHHSVFFQRFYDKHKEGLELFIETLGTFSDECACREAEEQHINADYDNLFNVSKTASGGDLVTYHPNRKRIYEKISATMLEQFRTGQRVSKPTYGKRNPNYRTGLSMKVVTTCPSCGKQWQSMRKHEGKLCKSCQAKERVGELNPFYGKQHSADVRQHLSDAQKKHYQKLLSEGKASPVARAVYAEGKLYSSNATAEKALNLSKGVVAHRAKSRNWEYRSYYYPDTPKKFEDMKIQKKDCICIVDGISYESPIIASKSLDIPYSTLIRRCVSDKEYAKNYSLKRPTSIESEYQVTQQVE